MSVADPSRHRNQSDGNDQPKGSSLGIIRNGNIGAIYPKLDGSRDFGLFRVAGAGLGNCLYSYFHAYILSLEAGAPLIHPAWPSLKLGPLLRGERSKRFYIGLFAPPTDEIAGLRKIAVLVAGMFGRKRVVTVSSQCEAMVTNRLIVSRCLSFGFIHFQPWRPQIRDRFIEMLRRKPALPIRWGKGEHVAVHVRLGDFAVATSGELDSGKVNNLRIPLDWYERVIRRVTTEFPGYPIHLFSDGNEHELVSLLAIEGVILRREPDDIGELLAMAEARLLIGSHSTFSRWAAFLGDMPTIWRKSEAVPEQPSAIGTPILFVGEDVDVISRCALRQP